MSERDGHIRYKAIAAVLIVLFIALSVLAIIFRLPCIASELDTERHIAMYLEEKNAEKCFPIYLHSANGPVRTERSISIPLLSDDLHLAAETLLLPETKDDISNGLISYIPDGTELIGISMKGGYLFADFTEELEDAPAEAFDEIVLTLFENTGADHIRILINGSESKAFDR